MGLSPALGSCEAINFNIESTVGLCKSYYGDNLTQQKSNIPGYFYCEFLTLIPSRYISFPLPQKKKTIVLYKLAEMDDETAFLDIIGRESKLVV